MTRKDYELIAKAVRCVRENDEGGCRLEDVVEALAEALQQDNPRFDKKRFRTAIYLPGLLED